MVEEISEPIPPVGSGAVDIMRQLRMISEDICFDEECVVLFQSLCPQERTCGVRSTSWPLTARIENLLCRGGVFCGHEEISLLGCSAIVPATVDSDGGGCRDYGWTTCHQACLDTHLGRLCRCQCPCTAAVSLTVGCR